MQTPEQFMAEYFAARTEEIRKQLEARRPFRDKYFTKDCPWDSKTGVSHDSESEMIVSVTAFLDGCEVVTKRTNVSEDEPVLPTENLKYILRPRGHSWVIEDVAMKCTVCELLDEEKCDFCNGTGWILDIDLSKFRSIEGEGPDPPRPPWRNRF